jgi:hypothetical protein
VVDGNMSLRKGLVAAIIPFRVSSSLKSSKGFWKIKISFRLLQLSRSSARIQCLQSLH